MGDPPFNQIKDLGVTFEKPPANHQMILGRIQEAPNLVLLGPLVNPMAPDQ